MDECQIVIDGFKCGSTRPGYGMVLCPKHEAQANRNYPQGWNYYPGDTCKHGAYVGGCGVDRVCPQCEMGE
jgi:hypothetical protein